MSVSEAVAAREEAIARVDANADRKWKAAYYASIIWCARELDALTTDDVRDRMKDHFPELSTPTPSASGPIIRRAATNGIISKTNHQNMTRDKIRHRDLTVWYSLLRGR